VNRAARNNGRRGPSGKSRSDGEGKGLHNGRSGRDEVTAEKKGLKACYKKAMAGKEGFGMGFTEGAANTGSEGQLNSKGPIKTTEKQQEKTATKFKRGQVLYFR